MPIDETALDRAEIVFVDAFERSKDLREALRAVIETRGRPPQKSELCPHFSVEREVISAVCLKFGVTTRLLGGTSKQASVVRARRVAFTTLRILGMSYPEIGRCFSRDHSTVIEGVRAVEKTPEFIAAAQSLALAVQRRMAAEQPREAA